MLALLVLNLAITQQPLNDSKRLTESSDQIASFKMTIRLCIRDLQRCICDRQPQLPFVGALYMYPRSSAATTASMASCKIHCRLAGFTIETCTHRLSIKEVQSSNFKKKKKKEGDNFCIRLTYFPINLTLF